MRLGTANRRYREHHRTLLAKATLRDRCYVLDRFTRHIGPDVAVKAIKPEHVSEWLNSLQVSASTMRLRLGQVRALFTWCVEMGWTRVDPTLTLKPPRQPRSLPRALTHNETNALGIALPDNRARLIVSLGVFEGLRRAEICGLELADIDLGTETIRVMGKGGHERVLPLTASSRHFLELYVQEERGRGGGALIRSRTTGGHLTPNTLGHLVSQWMKDAGLKASAFDGRSTHALRHTMATTLYNRSVDLRVIAAALGHASTQTTWRYLKHLPDLNALRLVMGQTVTDKPVYPEVRPIVAGVPFELPSYLRAEPPPDPPRWHEAVA